MDKNSKDKNTVLVRTIGTFGEIISARIPVTPNDTKESIVVRASKRINEKRGK